jgi:methylisocitrate lyase
MSSKSREKRLTFRQNLKDGVFMTAPGIYDALSAKLAQQAGLNCLAMGGYAISASRLGCADVGLLSVTEMAESLRQIADATDVPLIGDGDTGYGNPVNVIRTVHQYESSGASCLFLEDQVWPKRCGHMEGKQVIEAKEHVQKIRAACEARDDKNLAIMARTDARTTHGFDEAIRRGFQYAEAGAELLFIEALQSREELEKAAKAFEGSGIYLFANMIEGGKTPLVSTRELKEMGYAGVFWSCLSLYLVSKTLLDGFTRLQQTGISTGLEDAIIDFADFNSLVGLEHYRELVRKYQG